VALVQAHEAEDLFQQTWLRVVEKIRSFDASCNFEAWLRASVNSGPDFK